MFFTHVMFVIALIRITFISELKKTIAEMRMFGAELIFQRELVIQGQSLQMNKS